MYRIYIITKLYYQNSQKGQIKYENIYITRSFPVKNITVLNTHICWWIVNIK